MADKEGSEIRNDGGQPPADDKLLAELDQRIQTARRTAKWARPQPDKETAPSKPSDMSVALRLSSEFISGVVVGAAIGWGLDRVFGTMPLCLVIFTGLGTVAGVRNVLRATRAYDEAHKSGGVKQDQSGQSPVDKR